MISLTTGSVELSRRLCDACKIFKTTVSFGSVNSLCEMPCTMSHASIPSEKRSLPEDLVRLSIGIEDARDLIADLTHALEVAANPKLDSQENVDGYDSRFEDLPVVPDFGRQCSARSNPATGSTCLPSTNPEPSPSIRSEDEPIALPIHGSCEADAKKKLCSKGDREERYEHFATLAPAVGVAGLLLALWCSRKLQGRS
jgi:hypothetical protein